MRGINKETVNNVDRIAVIDRTVKCLFEYTKIPFWPVLTVLFLIFKLVLGLDVSWLLVFAPIMAMIVFLGVAVAVVLVYIEIKVRIKGS